MSPRAVNRVVPVPVPVVAHIYIDRNTLASHLLVLYAVKEVMTTRTSPVYGSSVAAERSIMYSLDVPSYSHTHTHTGTILVQVEGV
jgi:hypothetical protein